MTNFSQLLDQALVALEGKGLFANINKRKRRGISRSKRTSTIDPDTYVDMKSWGDDTNYILDIIKEALDSPVDVKWVNKTSDFWRGRFYIDNPESGKSYSYDIDIMKLDADCPVWEISFYMTGDNEESYWDGILSGQRDSDWATYKITGTGRSNTVFATVLNAIKQWVQTTNPSVFYMTALEDSRVSLYKALFKRFLPKDWRFALIGHDFWAVKGVDDDTQIEKMVDQWLCSSRYY